MCSFDRCQARTRVGNEFHYDITANRILVPPSIHPHQPIGDLRIHERRQRRRRRRRRRQSPGVIQPPGDERCLLITQPLKKTKNAINATLDVFDVRHLLWGTFLLRLLRAVIKSSAAFHRTTRCTPGGHARQLGKREHGGPGMNSHLLALGVIARADV